MCHSRNYYTTVWLLRHDFCPRGNCLLGEVVSLCSFPVGLHFGILVFFTFVKFLFFILVDYNFHPWSWVKSNFRVLRCDLTFSLWCSLWNSTCLFRKPLPKQTSVLTREATVCVRKFQIWLNGCICDSSVFGWHWQCSSIVLCSWCEANPCTWAAAILLPLVFFFFPVQWPVNSLHYKLGHNNLCTCTKNSWWLFSFASPGGWVLR